MRLKRIRPIHFRCYGDSDWINLDSDLVILYGPNGYGKTSLVESVEWLLHGRAKRRQRGQKYSKRDYKNYFQNAHAPEDATTAVEAEIAIEEKTYTIRRELQIGQYNEEETTTYVDGEPAKFKDIRLTEDTVYDPVIPQHSLQDFLHSRPKERRDKVSAALGLEPLVRFNAAVEKAKNNFRTDPPAVVRKAESNLRKVFRAIRDTPDDSPLTTLSAKWGNNNFDLTNDRSLLAKTVREYLDDESLSWDDFEVELQKHRREAKNRVFDRSPIRPPDSWEVKRNELRDEKADLIDEQLPTVREALVSYLSTVAQEYSRELLSFWETGLKLQKDNSDSCPLCEEDTLDERQRAKLEQRIKETSESQKADKELSSSSSRLSRAIRDMSRNIDRMFPSFLDDNSRQQLKSVFPDSSERRSFFQSHDETEYALFKTKEALNEVADRVESLPDLASDLEQVSDAKSVLEDAKIGLNQACSTITSLAKSYAEHFHQFDDELDSIISSSETIKQIDSLLTPIKHWDSVKVLAAHQTLLEETLEVERNVKEHLQNKQKKLFNTRGKEIKKWYGMMNPGTDVVFSRMQTGAESLHLFAETFGEELNAAASLSQCQANCLGLSIHFMRALSPDSPFNFLVLDDPVQSMDDDHVESLCRNVIDRLLNERNVQLVVSSHMRELTDKINDIYYHRLPLYQRFSDIQRSGPAITDNETIEDCLDRAKSFAGGNEDSRRLAVDIIRRATEKLIRAVCRRKQQEMPPVDATAKQMLPNFQRCPDVKMKYVNTLRDTIEFSNPAHHEDPQWSVPKKSAIQSHISTLSSYSDLFKVN